MFNFIFVSQVRALCPHHTVWTLALLLVFSLWPASTLFAAEEERFIVRGGPIWLKADNTSGDLKLDGVLLPGASLGVDDVLHHGLFLTLPVCRNLSLETIVSTPLEVDILAAGGVLGSEFLAAKIDAMPLMLIGRYTPKWNWHGIRPFAGIGVTYLWFENAKTTEAFDAVGASFGLQNPSIDVDNQLRPVVELGVDYLMGEHWLVNATWLYLEGDTKIAVVYSNGNEMTSDVSYGPQFFTLALGYRF